jgi:hypothetical protein
MQAGLLVLLVNVAIQANAWPRHTPTREHPAVSSPAGVGHDAGAAQDCLTFDPGSNQPVDSGEQGQPGCPERVVKSGDEREPLCSGVWRASRLPVRVRNRWACVR